MSLTAAQAGFLRVMAEVCRERGDDTFTTSSEWTGFLPFPVELEVTGVARARFPHPWDSGDLEALVKSGHLEELSRTEEGLDATARYRLGPAAAGWAVILTPRLRLLPCTPGLVQAALEGRSALAATLGVEVPADWPHPELDEAALRFMLARLEEGPAQAGWWLYLAVTREAPTLVGSGGYKGPPDAQGTVEVGYGIVASRQRQGLATELTGALVARAFSVPAVRRVVAETLPDGTASQGVLRRCGFVPVPGASEPGVLRFALERPPA